jgi:hypothetical protein
MAKLPLGNCSAGAAHSFHPDRSLVSCGLPESDSSDQVRPRRSANYVFLLLAFGGVATIGFLLWELLAATGGNLVYTMDDTYIALALSESIARGQYGINNGEFASPSSSILYPFLLAPAAGTSFHVAMPLVLNVLGLALSLVILTNLALHSEIANGLPAQIVLAALVFLGTLYINMYGVVFAGLEHSMHIAATLLILAGLIIALERHRAPFWLVAAIVCAPLFRFEGLVASGAAILLMLILRLWQPAAVATAMLAASVGTYFLSMHALGLPLLPASVLAKSPIANAGLKADFNKAIETLLNRATEVWTIRPARILLIIAGLALLRPFLGIVFDYTRFHFREVLLPAFVAVVTLGHALGGGFFWLDRYDVYALAAGMAGLLYIYRQELSWAFNGLCHPARQPFRFAIAGIALFCLAWSITKAGTFHIMTTRTVGLAARNIYEQQGQMSRFARELYRAPVAVNDLGYVAWRNPNYVLDLVGLGSEEVRQERDRWAIDMHADLMRKHNIGLAMIYDYRLPAKKAVDWIPVAYLRLGSPRVAPASDTVTFYRTALGDAERINNSLREFQKTLPSGVQLEFWPECGKRANLSDLNLELPDGSSPDTTGTMVFRCPLTVELGAVQTITNITLQVDGDSDYWLRLLDEGNETRLFVPGRRGHALYTRAVETRPVRVDEMIIEATGQQPHVVARVDLEASD